MTDPAHLEQQVVALRERFTPPIGRWTTSSGTFESMMGEDWVQDANGTGERVLRGAFGEPRTRIQFR